MSYGFKTWNADGAVSISDTEVAVRLVDSQFVAGNVGAGTTTISSPSFDSGRGFVMATPYTFKTQHITFTRIADSASLPGQYRRIQMQFGDNLGNSWDNIPPSLSFNNTTKVLTVTRYADTISDWRINFYHFK